MPEEVRLLGQPWKSLIGRVPHLTTELERDFRFGHTVFPFSNGFRLGGSVKGGSSTTWRPATIQDAESYMAWQKIEGIPENYEDLEAFEALADLLAANQIELWNFGHSMNQRMPAEYLPKRGWIYRATLDTLRALPAEHLHREEFSAIQIGGWGPASAKASAYESGRIFIYDFAIGGAKRTMIGLLLHEIGHAHEAAINDRHLSELAELHEPLASANALFGL